MSTNVALAVAKWVLHIDQCVTISNGTIFAAKFAADALKMWVFACDPNAASRNILA